MKIKIIKVKRKNITTKISTTVIGDEQISLKAKGLFAMLVPFDRKLFNIKNILPYSKDGISACKSAFKELIDIGCITTEKVKNKNGKFKGYILHVYKGVPIE